MKSGRYKVYDSGKFGLMGVSGEIVIVSTRKSRTVRWVADLSSNPDGIDGSFSYSTCSLNFKLGDIIIVIIIFINLSITL